VLSSSADEIRGILADISQKSLEDEREMPKLTEETKDQSVPFPFEIRLADESSETSSAAKSTTGGVLSTLASFFRGDPLN
jgi:hypothetical protein